uniref:Uncharacterized protein n=1 Tax=Arundo donax TaxID=35708 RepID=A0A0A9EFZ2_ARUDO
MQRSRSDGLENWRRRRVGERRRWQPG